MNKFLNEKNLDILLSLALLMLFVPALLPLFDMEGEWMIYVYTAGAILAVLSRVLQRAAYRKDKSIPLRVRRLKHIEFWSSMCYLVSAYFRVSDPYYYHPENWIAFLLAGAALQVYTSFMIPYQLKKAGREDNKNQ